MANLTAGTAEWLETRKRCITATDIGVLLGYHKDKTPLVLYEEKKGIREPDSINAAMQHGIDTEPKACKRLHDFTGITFKPHVAFHAEHPYFMASLDGVDFSFSRACEIKCPYNRLAFEADKKRCEPRKSHYAQMQWQMYCMGLQSMIYYVYWSDDEWIILECVRCDEFIEMSKEAADAFYECLQTDTLPEDKYVRPVTGEVDFWVNEILECKRVEKDIKERLNAAKTALLEYSDFKPVKAGPVRIEVSTCKGSVDYKSIPDLQNIDLEIYRKPSYVKYSMYVED